MSLTPQSRSSLAESLKTAAAILGSLIAVCQAIFKTVPSWALWVVGVVLAGIAIDALTRAWRRWVTPRLERRSLLKECNDYMDRVRQFVDEMQRLDLGCDRDDSFIGLFQRGRFQDQGGSIIQVPPSCTGVNITLNSLAIAIMKRTGQGKICSPIDAMLVVDVCDKMYSLLSECYRLNWLPFLQSNWNNFNPRTLSNIRLAWQNLNAKIREYNTFRKGTKPSLRNVVNAIEAELPPPLPS